MVVSAESPWLLVASPLGVLRPTPRWEHCPRGHRLMPGRMLVGSIACSGGQAHHLAMRPRRAVTNGAPLVNGCSLPDVSLSAATLPD